MTNRANRSPVDYTTLDRLIVEKIRGGARTFNEIDTGHVTDEAAILANGNGLNFRYIDRRLQALRKKGLIRYSTSEKWQVNA